MKRIFSLVQALLFMLSAFAAENADWHAKLDRLAVGMTASTHFVFDPIKADALAVTAAETAQCRDWFDRHVRLTSGDLSDAAFSLTVGGRSARRYPQDWTITVGEESEANAVCRGGKMSVTTLTHRAEGLVVEVQAIIYEAYAACEWTVFVRNPSAKASCVVSRFYAMDCALPTGDTELLVSRGSSSAADDFELCRLQASRFPIHFDAKEGRNTTFLPFFNLNGSACGVMAAVGWTGQWRASLRQTRDGVQMRAAQSALRGHLDAGETIRSPRMSCVFYHDPNPIKGFHTLRRWETDCVVPENAFAVTTNGYISEFDRRTCDEMVRDIEALPQSVCDEANCVWMDAGWYTSADNWYDTVGDWTPDAERFPRGLKPFSDALHQRGLRFLLWYEPERCCAGTQLYRAASQHPGWLLERRRDGNVNMFNLANDDACDYLTGLISQSVRDNGVDVYRQDFNFDPLHEWRQADRSLYGGRKGFEENHYVTNLYRFLDRLVEENPGLMIDNCASGGRRIDMEMLRRSVPLWRSDYNCATRDGKTPADVLEATQAQTYALSCWMPLHGTGVFEDDTYAARTGILPCSMRLGYSDVRRFMTQSYFPLTVGGTDATQCLAMQFGTAAEGAALLYVRRNVSDPETTVCLSGLEPDTLYTVWSYDDPQATRTMLGDALMRKGIAVPITQRPEAVILLYAVNNAEDQ